jgi:hypothetical protein
MTTTTEQILDTIRRLQSRKEEIWARKSSFEIARENFERKWSVIEYNRRNNFGVYLNKMMPIVQLEHGVIESVRDFVPAELLSELQLGFVKIRETDNLQQLNGIYYVYQHDVKIRQVLKLIFAVYRYNRNMISGKTDAAFSIYKSRIKHATTCPHCGEIAKNILLNMMETKMVLLPE